MSEWTADQLKDHFETLLEMNAQAVRTALIAAEKRLDGMNEFRASLADQQRTFLPRKEAEQVFHRFDERLQSLTKTSEELANRRLGITAGWSIALSVLGLISLVIGVLLSLRS